MTDAGGRGAPGARRTGLREAPGGSGQGWSPTLLRILVAVLVLGGAYVAAALYFKDRPPAGVSVEGVSIGNLTRDEAEEQLATAFGDRATDPITVWLRPEGGAGDARAGDDTDRLQVVPEEAGLSLDLDATLDGVTGLSFDPRVLWSHVSGGARDLPLVGVVERPALEAELDRRAQDYDTEPVEGEVRITDAGVEVVDAAGGRALDVPATADAVAAAWQDQAWDADGAEGPEVEGAAVALPPALGAEEVERFRTREVEPALSAPVVVTATRDDGDGDDDEQSATAELGVRDLQDLLQVAQDDGTLSLGLDEEGLLARVRQDLGQLEAGPQDATVRLEGSDVEVVPSRVGYALQEDGLVDAVRAALTAEGEGRTVELEVETVEPEIPTEASEAWEFETMSTFVSEYPGGESDAARTANLRTGIDYVNGTVVMPGEQFSLAAALGDISLAGGYAEAPIIQDGRLVMGVGGGLSQVSTVVFNASWFAGVQLDAHTPHTFYIARYPAGREATLAVPVIDNLWTNDTDNPIVVRAWTDASSIHMEYLGKRQYDVQTIDGERRNVTRGERVTDDSPDCVYQNPAEGFTITNVRVLSQDGQEVHRDEFTTTYQPADEVVCTDAG